MNIMKSAALLCVIGIPLSLAGCSEPDGSEVGAATDRTAEQSEAAPVTAERGSDIEASVEQRADAMRKRIEERREKLRKRAAEHRDTQANEQAGRGVDE